MSIDLKCLSSTTPPLFSKTFSNERRFTIRMNELLSHLYCVQFKHATPSLDSITGQFIMLNFENVFTLSKLTLSCYEQIEQFILGVLAESTALKITFFFIRKRVRLKQFLWHISVFHQRTVYSLVPFTRCANKRFLICTCQMT